MTDSTSEPSSPGEAGLAVVVVAVNGAASLERSLQALAAQPHADTMTTLVVYDAGDRAVAALESRFPQVVWLPAPAGATVPRMRSLGLTQAEAPVVALLEDDCVVEPQWSSAVLAAHASPDVAIGGAVEPGPYRRALDWAVYFCEYGRFMRPLAPGAAVPRSIAGTHVTYKRVPLSTLLRATPEGFVDYFVHDEWQKAGQPMRTENRMGVANVNSWSLDDVTSVPFHHGRAFAGTRAGSHLARLVRAVASPALPLLIGGRIIGDVVSKRRFVWRLIYALPWVALFVTSWSIGEAVGSVRGPGTSAARWRARVNRVAEPGT